MARASGYGPAMTSGSREPDPRPVDGTSTSAADEAARTPTSSERSTPSRPLEQHVVEPTRTGGIWGAVIVFTIVLLLLLIFILQNNRSVPLQFLGFDGSMPLGVAMLMAAVLGALLVAMAGVARVLQLRRVAKRHRAADRT
jgi:lipopolysaccharide assembly protein A